MIKPCGASLLRKDCFWHATCHLPFAYYLTLCLALVVLITGCGRVLTPTPQAAVILTATSVPSTATLTPAPSPTATLLPATPLPSPTPTVTPTPIIYTIQPGDTLLKIALQFNQAPEVIQEVNGILDPRFLQIGQALIIPLPDSGQEASPTVTSTPLPVKITALNFQETQQGTLWSLGQVTNPGDVPLTEVVIEAALFDANGVLLAREAAPTQLDVLQPGQSLPFALLFKSPPSSFAQYQVRAIAAVPLVGQTRYYFDLETFDLRGSPAGLDIFRVNGQLRNRGQVAAEFIRLVTVAYNKEGQLLVQRQANLGVNLLRAGATTPFEIELLAPYGSIDHFEVLAQGLRVE